MSEREQFEAAWRKEYPLHGATTFQRSGFNAAAYVNTRVQDGWLMWQAALLSASKPAGPITDTQIARFATDARQHEAMEFSGGTKVASHDNVVWAIRRALFAASPAASFQERVQPWMVACFGVEIAADKIERNHRFFEEAAEAVQANGMTRSEAHQLVDYTFDRPIGELHQEIGGVMVTLAALCLASGQDMHAAGETELARIWTKVEAIRAKQAAKPKHSPLPAAPAQSKDALTRELLDTLQMLVKHFTQTPSTLADSQARGKAHEVIAKAYAQIGYSAAPAQSGEPSKGRAATCPRCRGTGYHYSWCTAPQPSQPAEAGENLPCPICKGIEGCDHTVLERVRASAVALDDGRAAQPLTQEIIDFCWEGYKVGQISADHTAKEVFTEVLQNLAKWLNARAASPQATVCATCNGHSMIGGPSYYAPDEGGEPCPDCATAAQPAQTGESS